jgi:enterochelin esterase-like enzyme
MSIRTILIVSFVAFALVLAGCTATWLVGKRLPGTANPALAVPKTVKWVNDWNKPPPRLQHLAFPSEAMGHKVGVSILPPAHDKPAPLIIFLHGRGGDETTDLYAFMGLLRKVVAARGLPEPLVVFPNGGVTGYRGAMATMIVEELLSYLEQHYRLDPARNRRLLAGFSMGGGGAVRLQLQYPELFGGAASWGGGVWHRDAALFDSVLARADQMRELGPHFLLVNGSEDRPNAFAPLTEVFQQIGVAHKRVVFDGVGHHMGIYFDQSEEVFGEFLQELWSSDQ